MPQAKINADVNDPRNLLLAFAVNEKMNQMVLQQINPVAWSAKLAESRTRTIAAIFAHTHNIRCKWIRLSAPHLKAPAMLDRASTQRQTRTAFRKSAARCTEMIEGALFSAPVLVPQFLRDGWAQPWPAGPMMVTYMITHEAHHRGQVCMLAHQLGYPLSASATSAMWNWERIQKECTVVKGLQSRRAPKKASG